MANQADRKKIEDPGYSYRSEAPLPREQRVAKLLAVFADLLKADPYRQPLELYLDTCAKCNNCAEQCQVYQATGDIRDLPAWRSDLLRRIYRKYFTASGKIFGSLVGAKEATPDDIDAMVEGFYHCMMCRRCAVNCPLAVDNAMITRIGRVILGALGFVPKNMTVSARAQLTEGGNTSSIPKAAFIDTLDFLEEELKDETGMDIPIPRDAKGAEYLFAAPVSDYIMEADTLLGIVKTLHAAGARWSISTENYDAINYGLFFSDDLLAQILNRLLAAAQHLGCKTLVIGECGHATKAALLFQKVYGQTQYKDIRIKSIIEVSYEFFRAGRLKFNPGKNPDPVTYHDPCNLGRGVGLYEEPRELLKAAVEHYIEMTPNRQMNYCCGGGGGLVVAEDLHDWRMTTGGLKKVEQLRAAGARIVVAPCANCKKQLRELIQYHKLNMEIAGLHDLIGKAIILGENS